MQVVFVLLALLAMPSTGTPTIIHVPGDARTIQDGIDLAKDGDTVLVQRGTYIENIDFKGKAITVKSTDGPKITIIDGGSPVNPFFGSVATFVNQEGPDSVLEGFTLTNGKGAWVMSSFAGGGIFCESASPTIRNNIIRDNVLHPTLGVFGGGIFCHGDARFLDNTFSGNAAFNGGGICCFASSPVIMGNHFLDNLAQGDGGAIDCRAGGAPVIKGNHIHANQSHGLGGGIACSDGSSAWIEENTLTGNMAGTGTGPGWGGGIGCGQSSPVIFRNTISENSATRAGGAVFAKQCDPGFPVLRDNAMYQNVGMMRGGALMISKTKSILVQNNFLVGNRSPFGGAIHFNDSLSGLITNNTICFNTDDNYPGAGGGIYCNSHSTLTCSNTIFWGNTAGMGPAIYVGSKAHPSSLTIGYCDIEGGVASVFTEAGCTLNFVAGNIDADPKFIEPGNRDYHLRYTSPCRDSGHNAVPGLPGEDYEGDPRIADGVTDMGADEFFNHLYYVGDAVPGGSIQIRIIGRPGTPDASLWFGVDVIDPPVPSNWGDWYLAFPLFGPLFPGTIPPGGVLPIPLNLPPTLPDPYTIPMQTHISDVLSNLSVIEVE